MTDYRADVIVDSVAVIVLAALTELFCVELEPLRGIGAPPLLAAARWGGFLRCKMSKLVLC